MRLGQKAMEALQAEVTGCLQPGDELVVACPVALGGTSRIAKQEREKLSERFSAGFVCDCMLLQQEYGFSKKDHEGRDMSNLHLEEKAEGSSIWQMAVQAGASALYAMGEGGFLSALWKVAEASQVGLTVDFRKVPVRQETIEVCEIFDLYVHAVHICMKSFLIVTFYLVMAALQVCFSQSTSPKNIFQLSSFSIIPHARVFRKY